MFLLFPNHPFVSSYRLFLGLCNSTGIQMLELSGIDPARPAQFLKSIQLLTSVYWQSITALSPAQARILPAPDFTQLFNDFCVQSCNAPQLTGVPMRTQTPSTALWPAPSQPPASECRKCWVSGFSDFFFQGCPRRRTAHVGDEALPSTSLHSWP